MSNARLHRLPERPLTQQSARLSLARTLIESNLVTPWQMFFAMRCQSVWNVTLPEVLMARGWVSRPAMREVLAKRGNLPQVDLTRTPPAPSCAHLLPPEFCLKYNVIPWANVGETVILVTGRPHQLEALKSALPATLKDAHFSVSGEASVQAHIALHHRRDLTEMAETCVSASESCRGFGRGGALRKTMMALALITLTLVLFPMSHLLVYALTGWTIVTLMAATCLRACALFLYLRPPSARRRPSPLPPAPKATPAALPASVTADGERVRLPRISVMVPLFREPEIASALIRRLTHLTYPRALLDVVLVLEEKDQLTRRTIARTSLPRWMRVVEVPAGSGITTKPRALNYALPFCKGEIIGIWDAEDAPAPDQLEKVAHHFDRAASDVACLQGVLDYYNPYTNWLSRCFAIEYAAWFRLVLPSLTRLGFAVPLGGTTLFLRRDVIETVGGWDSHNVTEDADLGMRLARHGYRTELLESVTQEEANCRPIAWVRQRSRWLKGYMATYLVHMRAPRRLWRELGPRQFLGFQLLFLCTLSQFLLAPFLWSLWAAALGAPHPLSVLLPSEMLILLASALFLSGVTNGALWIFAVHASKRAPLYPWTLTMAFYFPLATLAAYKGLIEMLVAPFYWDKTSHGKTAEATGHDAAPQISNAPR